MLDKERFIEHWKQSCYASGVKFDEQAWEWFNKKQKGPKEGNTMTDDEGAWFFEDGQWWLE